MVVKRFFDIAIAAIVLVVCSPIIALTALAVGLSLGRPLMFWQERAGRGMRSFHITKFRTMTDARNAQGELLADKFRQTGLTAFLRRVRVDELPQLFAVLSGDMSFIGPRPLPRETLRAFGEIGELRCLVRPGMTGWAQVNGNTLLTNQQKIALDIWYVDNSNLLLDIRILLLTIKTLIVGETLDADNIELALAHLSLRGQATSSMQRS
jgi:lipopolysaccharide/colanic/teichoic acid biosynthesis glycosyltransferase